MKLYSEIVESRNQNETVDIKELADYVEKTKRMFPQEVELVLQYLLTYKITDREMVENILKANKSTAKAIAKEVKDLDADGVMDMQKLLKNLKDNIKLLPMYMTVEQRRDIISGRKNLDDITLDLESEKGRQECAKKYAKLVIAIASKFKNKSGLDWNGLISAGQLGLTKAINDYKRPAETIDVDDSVSSDNKEEAKTQKSLSFKQYAGWRIRNQILNDINNLSRTVRITQHEYEKNKNAGNTKGNFNTVSVDQTFSDEDGTTFLDRMPELSSSNDAFKSDLKKSWEKCYKYIDDKFSARDASIFYKYFGIRDYKQKTGTEIAKEVGLTGARVSLIISAILKFLRDNPKTSEILDEIRDMYAESILVANYNKDQQTIIEALINDDIYLVLEELTRWDDKTSFNNTVGEALDCFEDAQSDFLLDCLHNDFDFIDENYQTNKKLYINFLERLYPTECIKKRSDVDILNRMGEINEYFHKHNLTEEE